MAGEEKQKTEEKPLIDRHIIKEILVSWCTADISTDI
jgi:hypothetical protein